MPGPGRRGEEGTRKQACHQGGAPLSIEGLMARVPQGWICFCSQFLMYTSVWVYVCVKIHITNFTILTLTVSTLQDSPLLLFRGTEYIHIVQPSPPSISRTFSVPTKTLYSLSNNPLGSALGKCHSTFCPMRLTALGTSQKWSHVVLVLLSLAYFT